MPFKLQVTYRGLPRIKASDVNAMKRRAMAEVARTWHDDFASKKFTTAAARRYNYAPRFTKNVRTGQIKKSKKGRPLAPSGLPLVWSSRSRALQKVRRIKSTANKGVVSDGIRQFNVRRSPKSHPRLDMLKEYQKILPSEERTLALVARRVVREGFKKHKKRVQVMVY